MVSSTGPISPLESRWANALNRSRASALRWPWRRTTFRMTSFAQAAPCSASDVCNVITLRTPRTPVGDSRRSSQRAFPIMSSGTDLANCCGWTSAGCEAAWSCELRLGSTPLLRGQRQRERHHCVRVLRAIPPTRSNRDQRVARQWGRAWPAGRRVVRRGHNVDGCRGSAERSSLDRGRAGRPDVLDESSRIPRQDECHDDSRCARHAPKHLGRRCSRVDSFGHRSATECLFARLRVTCRDVGHSNRSSWQRRGIGGRRRISGVSLWLRRGRTRHRRTRGCRHRDR